MRKTILQTRGELAESIRTHVRDQVEVWRRVPRLALDADGRQGYSSRYSMAYDHGYWDLTGRLYMMVDLLSAEIIVFSGHGRRRDPIRAPDDAVVVLSDDVTLLDAGKIVRELQEKAREPIKYDRTEAELDAWRAEISRRLDGLGETYEEKNRKGLPVFGVIF